MSRRDEQRPLEANPAKAVRWPAEWERHEATWLSWPHNPETWPGRLETIPDVFAQLVAGLHEHEEVRILVRDAAMEAGARQAIRGRRADSPNVRFFHVATNDSWARDHGPIFVHDPAGRVVLTNWTYNAWGGKYPPWDLDDAVPARLAEILGLAVRTPGLVLEGGSIDGNGEGTLLTTEQCLLNRNRNPGLSRPEIERKLREHLGATNVLWLGEGIAGDDTDGHVDDITRFVSPSRVVTVVEDDPADPNYKPLLENLRALHGMKNERGLPLEVATLPMPRPVFDGDVRLPASYGNFYIGNGAVLVPVFGDPRDDEACDILAGLFPGRKIVPIRCENLIAGLGAIHCVTQQQPAPRL